MFLHSIYVEFLNIGKGFDVTFPHSIYIYSYMKF